MLVVTKLESVLKALNKMLTAGGSTAAAGFLSL